MSDSFFSSLLGRDMAVDLGTANTLVYVRGRGIVLNEPSVVAVNIKDGRPLAVGLEAKRMIGRTPAHIGAGLPVAEPTGNMVVDIGGGTTEVAVISLGGIVTSQSIRIGGDELDDAIIQHIKKEYSLALGERTSEEIKIALGSAWPLEEELHAEIRGRDLVTGLPKTIVTSTEEIRRAIEEPVSAIVDAVKVTVDKTPPELAADIMEQGIVLTGGGALLHGIDARLSAETGMPILIAKNPLHSVAIGSGQCLEEFQALKQVLISSSAR